MRNFSCRLNTALTGVGHTYTVRCGGSAREWTMRVEVWGECRGCGRWFFIEDPCLDALLRCPACLTRAENYERRIILDGD